MLHASSRLLPPGAGPSSHHGIPAGPQHNQELVQSPALLPLCLQPVPRTRTARGIMVLLDATLHFPQLPVTHARLKPFALVWGRAERGGDGSPSWPPAFLMSPVTDEMAAAQSTDTRRCPEPHVMPRREKLTCHSFGSACELGTGALRQDFLGLIIFQGFLLLRRRGAGSGARGRPGLCRGGRWRLPGRRARGLTRLCKRNRAGAEHPGVQRAAGRAPPITPTHSNPAAHPQPLRGAPGGALGL